MSLSSNSDASPASCAAAAAAPSGHTPPSGSSEGGVGHTGRGHPCGQCGTPLFQSEALICLPDESLDWQGDLNLRCRWCWSEESPGRIVSAAEWRRWCKASWLQRAVKSKGHFQRRVRCQGFQQAKEDIGQRHPGESLREYRMRLLAATVKVAGAIAAAFTSGPSEVKAARISALADWHSDWQLKAANPDFVPEVRSVGLQDQEAQFLSEIAVGVHEFFLCRHKGCLFVCRNTDWAQTEPEGGHYACPRCGQQYRPWKVQPGYCPTNKVLLLEQEALERAQGIWAASGSSEAAAWATSGKGRCLVVPIMWAETSTQTLVNRFKEIMTGMDEELEQMTPAQRLAYVIERVRARFLPAAFTRYYLDREAVTTWQHRNSMKPPPHPQWSWQHLLDGFYGFHALTIADSEPMQQEDLIRLWGLVRWLSMQADSRL